MPLSNDEKRCLAVAKKFLEESKKELKFPHEFGLGETAIVANGSMVGNMAAQKYGECIQAIRPKSGTHNR